MSFRTKAMVAGASALLIATPLVAEYEGRSLVAYLDPVGIPTICEGYTWGVYLGDVKTHSECDKLTEKELVKAIRVVEVAVDVPLSETRKAALASFVYNVGPTRFLSSTLLDKLNSGDTIGACNELSRWVYAKGKKYYGLVRRREAERKLCLVGTAGSVM
jgi:lysozyme